MGYPTYNDSQLTVLKYQVERVTRWLDEHQIITPEADDALRVGKLLEEGGEAMQKYIGWIGQNPRKGVINTKYEFLEEVADSAMTALCCIQHFTQDIEETFNIMFNRARYVKQRVVREEAE